MLEIKTATGGPFDLLGELIEAAGREDSSGERRFFAIRLQQGNLEIVANGLDITIERAEELRQMFAVSEE
jgi:hypothetical protein